MDMIEYKREPLTQAEATALRNACETPEENLIVTTLLETGLRVAEFCSVTRSSVDFQTHRLTISHGKGDKRRVLKLSPVGRAVLEPWLKVHNGIGMSTRTAERIVTRVASRAQIDRATSPHVLRHTFAVHALQRGISLRTLMHWLGHSHLSTTALYLNLSPDDAIADMERSWK